MRRLAIAVLLSVLASGALAQSRHAGRHKDIRGCAASPVSLPEPAMQAINADRIRAHVKFLASNLLEGRGPGQRGGELAAEYIATQLALLGLKPAGDNGTFLQNVPLVGVTTLPETTFEFVAAGTPPLELVLRDDYVAYNQALEPVGNINAEVAYVGYGIQAPEYGWDDYKGADLRGKVLLMLVNEPPSEDENFFKGKILTYYGRWTYKFEEAARRGAVGVVLVHKTEMAGYPWGVVRNTWGGETDYLRDPKTAKLKVAGWVQLEVARKLLASAAGQSLDDLIARAQARDFKPVALPFKLRAHMVSKIRPFDSSNVVAELQGCDRTLRKEAVLYIAHYDQLGIGVPVDGDNIHKGAIDNATGVAMVLEMARGFTSAPHAPKRSILFGVVTGEEQGLVGSAYLGLHPPVPAGKITLVLNFDGIMPLGTPKDIKVPGAERTSFYPVVQQTARQFKLEIKADSEPNLGHYYRSDHFSLARVGVPAFYIMQGDNFVGHEPGWGLRQKQEYTAKRYHRPSDEYREDMDFAVNALLARFGVAVGWKAANMAQEVAWKPGDEFEATRKASLAGTTVLPRRK